MRPLTIQKRTPKRPILYKSNWLPLVEAFRTLLILLDADMLALMDGCEIAFEQSFA
jgi:hypothetical protein